MAEVIDLRARGARQQKDRAARERARGVAEALACGMCPHRCAYCGQPLDAAAPTPSPPFPLCEACREEYLAYTRREAGEAIPEAYWHNPEWAAVWRTWLANLKAREAFRQSAPFQRLLDELKS